VYLTPSLRAPLECVTALGLKLLQCWGYLAEKKFDDVFIRSDTIHECDGRHRSTAVLYTALITHVAR